MCWVLNGPAMRWFAALAQKQGFVVLVDLGGDLVLISKERLIDKPGYRVA